MTKLLIFQLQILGYLTGHVAQSSSCTFGPLSVPTPTMSGTIRSPGYPQQYYANENCHWLLFPPNVESYKIIVVNIQFDIHPLNATESHHCTNSKDYVEFGYVFGCGSEKSSCFVFITEGIREGDNCHKTYSTDYSHCAHYGLNEWPFVVSFLTDEQNHAAGFELNYTFIECGKERRGPQRPTPNDMKPKLITTITNTNTITITATTVKTQHSSPPDPDDSQLPDNGIIILAAVIAFLAVFIFIVIAATLRKRSRARKRSSEDNPSPGKSIWDSETKTKHDNFKKQAIPLETVGTDEAVERGH